MALGAGLIVLSIGLPYVISLPSHSYASVYAALLVIGVVAVVVRGWSKANRLWGERRWPGAGDAA